jgi:uncharacterized iron-regulated membrane protein
VRLDLDAIVAGTRRANPEGRPTTVAVRAEPGRACASVFGRESALYVDPYTGATLGSGSWLGNALHVIEDWHRWLGSRELGKPFTGAANLAFLGMAISGVFLWWPRASGRGPAASGRGTELLPARPARVISTGTTRSASGALRC